MGMRWLELIHRGNTCGMGPCKLLMNVAENEAYSITCIPPATCYLPSATSSCDEDSGTSAPASMVASMNDTKANLEVNGESSTSIKESNGEMKTRNSLFIIVYLP